MRLTVLVMGLLVCGTLHAQGADDRELPNVLIIGDSISLGYADPLKTILRNKANVVNIGNAGPSSKGLANIDQWLGKTKWDVIHFNHGLHDLKYVDAKGRNSNTEKNANTQVPLEDYRKNMESIVIKLKKTGAKLIFATTTPYPEGVKPLRIPEDAQKYNSAALEVMKQHDVPVNDLHEFVLPKLTVLQKPKNVHFTPEGSKEMANEVAKHILNAIGQQPAELDKK